MLRPTTKDLAKAAGVSRATVDRVLNGREGVKKRTVDRVNDAIKNSASCAIFKRPTLHDPNVIGLSLPSPVPVTCF